MSIKITNKIRSRKNDFIEVEKNDVLNWIKTNSVGYEVLLNTNCIPYYDFDNKYLTEELQKNNYDIDFNSAYNSVKQLYPDGKILSFASCGFDPKINSWKNSYHFRIRGVGYYDDPMCIPKIKLSDQLVYKKKSARQLIRLPYCSKEGNNRPLIRVENGELYGIDDIHKLGETIEDYLIQNTGEELLKNDEISITQSNLKDFKHIIKSDNKGEKDLIEIISPEAISFINSDNSNKDGLKDLIKNLCECLDTSRFDDRITWLRWIRCISNIGLKYKTDLKDIGITYSKKSNKFNEKEVINFFEKGIIDNSIIDPKLLCDWNKSNNKLLIGSLCYWAKLDNSYKYLKIFNKVELDKNNKLKELINEALINPFVYSFHDYTDFVNKEITQNEIIKFLCDTVIHIIDGGLHKIFTRSVLADGSTKFQIADYNLFGFINNFSFMVNSEPFKISEYFEKNYYHIHCYHTIDFIPYLEKNPVSKNIFNLFQGFQYKFNRMDIKTIPTEIELMFYHIKYIICDGDEEVYEYVLNYITHLFQKPAHKIGISILLQSNDHGTGKNRFTDFLMNCLGMHNIYKANKMEDVCSSFNYHMQGKLLVVGDEIANYASHKFADLLKALISEVSKAITPKGKDTYIIQSFERYIFTSNNDYCFRIEQGDRRLLPLRVSNIKKNDTEYFNKLSDIIDTTTTQELFFNYMASRDIEKWNYKNIPITNAKSELILESCDPAIHFIIDYCSNITDEHNVKCIDLFNLYKEWCINNSHRPQSDRKFGKEMKKLNIEKIRLMNGGGRLYYYSFNKKELEKTIGKMINNKNFKFDENPSGDDGEIYDSDDE